MPRIAVIAVHGVADQQPNETARSIAVRLHSIGREPGPFGPAPQGPKPPGGSPAAPARDDDRPSVRYSAFTETPLIVPVSPVRLKRTEGATPEGASSGRWRHVVRAGLYSAYAARHLDREIRRDEEEGLDYRFAHNQLEKYTGRDDPPSYETVMLSAEREHAAAQEALVDVYEMYWADLSRLGKGLLRILGEFYQLLFHVSSLGKTTVDLARISCGDAGVFPYLGFFQSLSSWILVLPIAILNLYLLLIAGGLLLVKIPVEFKVVAVIVVSGTLIAIIMARLVYERWWIGFWNWSLTQALGFVVGAVVGYVAASQPPSATYSFLTVLWIFIVLFAVDALAARYELRRSGASGVARACGVLVLVVAGAFLGSAADSPSGVVFLLGRTAEFIFVVLVALWAALIVCHLLTWLLGAIAILQTPGAGDREGNMRDPKWQVERAVWTGCMGMFLPTALFLILTLSLWAAVIHTLGNSLDGIAYQPYFDFLRFDRPGVTGFMEKLLDRSAGLSFNAFFALTAVALVMVIWGFFPAVLAEIAPPRDSLGDSSRKLGHWLDHGFDLARWAGGVALVATFVVLPGDLALVAFVPGFRDLLGGDAVLKVIGVILAGSAVGIVGLGSQLGKVFLGFRAGLDVAFDVDNWLRERPLEGNVRSRVCARYVSLLRHVCSYTDDQGKGYDALVILAHSQGTVITADLLRFLAVSPDPELARLGGDLPVYLFTVGCPLRQLYGRRFPHLYEWATHSGVGATGPQPNHDGLLPPDQRPDPGELRVQLWVNAFRSGDYVGRHLWLRDDYLDRWEPAQSDSNFVANDMSGAQPGISGMNRVELCIGAGAHTHYFDETGGRVAQILDQLIAVAIAGKPKYAWRFPAFRPGS